MGERATSVAVVGLGAVGGYFAAQAWRAGNDLSLCARAPFDRLVVETKGEVLTVEAPIHTDPGGVAPHDWVLLATKAHQSRSAVPWLDRLCGPETVVVVLQNGVEHLQRVGPLAGPATVLPAVVRFGGEALSPGHIRHHTYGYLYVPDGIEGHRLVDVFVGSDAEIHPVPDFETQAWSKLVTNVAANAIPALSQQRFPVFRRPDVAALARALMLECIAVAGAEGVVLSQSLADSEVERMAGLPDNVGSSMLYDRLAGRALEYDALNGAVVRAGKRHGIPTPLNEAMVALLGAISEAIEE
ncbi:MAG: 2-dehydropantoate 2-reductase [Acidimicrobiia bacterium]